MSDKTYAIPDFPWNILVVSDLNPRRQPSGSHSVDKNRFNELLEELSPSLSFAVLNTMASEPKHLDIDIKIKTIKDFSPDAVAAKVPVLSSLLELKEVLKKYHSGDIDKDSLLPYLSNKQVPVHIRSILENITGSGGNTETRPQPQAPSKPEAKDYSKEGSLENILNMTDIPEGDERPNPPQPPLSRPVDGLIQSVTEGYSTDISVKDIDKITKSIDSILAGQVSAVIHHPDFIALETAWRELKFLIDRTNFREGITIDVIACTKDTLCETLADKIFRPVWDTDSMAPDLIVTCHALNCTAVDFEIVENLAKFGQSTQTPVIAWAGHGFFKIDSYRMLSTNVPSISELIKGTGYEKWRGLREKSESDWLVMAANGFCLRNSYGKDGVKVKTFIFEEKPDLENLPTGAGSIAIVSMLSETFVEIGTEKILEKSGNPYLETLSTFTTNDNNSNPTSSTCIAIMNSDQVWDMTDSGLTPINCLKNDGKIFMASTNTFSNNDVSLPSMILAGHISRILISIARNNRNIPEKEAENLARAAIKKILINKLAGQYSGDCTTVKIEEQSDGSDERTYEIHVDVPYKICGDEVSVNVAFSL